jgi:predicted permease
MANRFAVFDSFRMLGSRIRGLFTRRRLDDDFQQELDSHLDLLTEENTRQGMSPKEARRAARVRLGGVTQLRETHRELHGFALVDTLLQDVRYAVRMLRKNPSFTAVAVLTLALGIGANTAIFQLLDAVRLRSLPIPHPEELAEVRIVGGNHGMGITPPRYGQLTRPIWQEIRDHHEPFSGVFAWSLREVQVAQRTEVRRANGIYVSGDFFRVLGVQPWRGRLILPEDEGASCPPTKAVVSYGYWQGEMGGRPLEEGTALTINGGLKEVIGVTPPGFFGLVVGDRFDIAIPFCQPKELRRDVFDITVMGRLRPGWRFKRASAWLDAISPGLFEATAFTGYSAGTIETYKRFRLAAYPASTGVSWLRTEYDTSLWLLLTITGLVLLIACANLASLMLARASSCEHEIAVRLALGASRGRVLRQLLTESALLAAIGATAGVGLAQLLSRVLVWSLSTESASINLRMRTDWRVLLFAAAVGAVTCAFFGAVPALRATDTEPVNAMKTGGRGMTGSRQRLSMQRLMVVTQITVSLVLLVGAFLFVRSFRNLITFNPGMRERGVTLAYIGFDRSRVTAAHYEEFQRELLAEVESVPGVLSAATTTNEPLLGGDWGHDITVGSLEGGSKFTWVSPGYFRTMGISLVMGRDFNQSDTRTSQRVAVVNETFVRQFLGRTNPIGKTLRTHPEPDYPSTVYEIVGVIPDTKYNDLRSQTPPMVFAPASQFPAPGPYLAMMIYSNEPSATVMAAVTHRIAEQHPEIVIEFADFQTRIRDGLAPERLMAILSGFFGFLAALLAIVGLYGVISYFVARRRNEIGIRMALGAQRALVVGMIMHEATRMLLIGLFAGATLSLLVGRWAASMLFGLKPYDPSTLAAAGVVLAFIGFLASFLPAHRASKVDPMVALRYE